MNNLREHFATDWSAMSGVDWFYTVLTVTIFLLMIGLYLYVFNPKNKKQLNSYSQIPFNPKKDREVNHGR